MDNTLENLLADSSFVLWLRGEGSAEEKEYWNNWFQKDPDRHMIVREAKEIIEAMDGEYEVPNPYAELEKLEDTIDQYERRMNSDRLKLNGRGYKQNKRFYQRTGIYIAAAVILLLLIILGSGLGYYYNLDGAIDKQKAEALEPQTEEYHTDYGEKLTFRLSDGSRITLNANSDLEFSSKIEKGLNTEVWLEGEAYFDIAHLENDQQRIFTVHTDHGSIQVLGTRFAVNTFQGETETVLEEGKINIRLDSSSAINYELIPGELARFKANDNKVAVKKVNTQIYTSWRDDKFVFENTPMEEVVERIEYTFGIKVVLGENLTEESLSGSIRSNNLDVLKEALEEVLNTQVNQKGKKLMIGI